MNDHENCGISIKLANELANSLTGYQTSFLPIWAEKEIGNKTKHVGTATLIKFKNKYYMLTATHCLNGAKDHTLFVIVNDKPFILESKLFTPIENSKNFDISFALCFQLGLIFSDENIINVSKLNIDQNGIFELIGFPNSKQRVLKKHLKHQIYTYTACECQDSQIPEKKRNEYPNHIFLTHTKKVKDVNNDEINTPELIGMSGGGVFVFSKSDIKSGIIAGQLCGILIEKPQIGNGYIIIATKFDQILLEIEKYDANSG